jgi:hypothetical protein
MTSNLQNLNSQGLQFQFNSLLTPPLCHNCALPGKIRGRCRFTNLFFTNQNTSKENKEITTCSMCLRHGKQYSNCCSIQQLTQTSQN